MKLTRLAAVTAVAAVAGLLLSACGGPNAAASAAVIGDQSVSNAALASYVADVRTQRQQPVDQPDLDTTTNGLSRLIVENLVAQSAAKLNVTVTEAEVQRVITSSEESVGGRAALEAELLQADIPASNLHDAFVMSIRLQKMGEVLVPDGDQGARNQAVFEYVAILAEELKPSVNPRFGTWDPAKLKVGALPTDLSKPVAEVSLIDPATAGQ